MIYLVENVIHLINNRGKIDSLPFVAQLAWLLAVAVKVQTFLVVVAQVAKTLLVAVVLWVAQAGQTLLGPQWPEPNLLQVLNHP